MGKGIADHDTQRQDGEQNGRVPAHGRTDQKTSHGITARRKEWGETPPLQYSTVCPKEKYGRPGREKAFRKISGRRCYNFRKRAADRRSDPSKSTAAERSISCTAKRIWRPRKEFVELYRDVADLPRRVPVPRVYGVVSDHEAGTSEGGPGRAGRPWRPDRPAAGLKALPGGWDGKG